MKRLICVILTTISMPLVSSASELVFEAGVFKTEKFDLSSGDKATASEGWDSGVNPIARIEGWSDRNNDSWSFGFVVQPFNVKYSEKLSADLNIDDASFLEGETIDVDFQFPNIRGSVNHPVLSWGDSYFRIGGTVVTRYVEIVYETDNDRAVEKGFLTIPLVNLMIFQKFSSDTSFSIQSDFISSRSGGLYDLFLGPRFGTWEFGARAFWGGFNPKRERDSNINIFYSALVLRKNF